MTQRGAMRAITVSVAVELAVLLPFAKLPETSKKGVYADSAIADEYFIVETEKTAVTPQIRSENSNSGMPCENREQFEAWYEVYCETAEGVGDEQETSEEAETTEVREHETSDEVSETETQETEEVRVATILINGDTLNPDFQRWIYNRLCENGIEYWFETMLCQMYQESRFDYHAVSADGRDHGILQYRLEYWAETCKQYGYDGADIYDPYVQVAIYIEQTKNRINQGLSGNEVVSRHKTSDYGVYDQVYVDQVLQWSERMEKQ